MALIIKKYKNSVNNPKTFGKTYGKAVILGTIDIDGIAAQISEMCTVTPHDIKAVLSALGAVVPRELSNSKRVILPGIGSLKLAVSTSGEVNEEDFNLQKNVKRVKVIYRPDITKDFYGRWVNGMTNGLKLEMMHNGDNQSQSAGTDEGIGGENSGEGIGEDRP